MSFESTIFTTFGTKKTTLSTVHTADMLLISLQLLYMSRLFTFVIANFGCGFRFLKGLLSAPNTVHVVSMAFADYYHIDVFFTDDLQG